MPWRRAVVAVASIAAPATADRASIHATGTGDIGVTDNVFSERFGQRDGDLFFQLRPGVLLSYGLPRMIHDLSAEAEVTQYTRHGEEASLTGRGAWNGLFIPGPRSAITLSAGGGTGRLTGLTSRPTSDQVAVELQPLGIQRFRTGAASEFGGYQATPHLRLSQRLFARATESTDNGSERDPGTIDTVVTSAEAGAAIGARRTWKSTSLALEVGTSVLRLERVAPVTSPIPSRLDRQLNPRLRTVWSRAFDRRVVTNVDVGLVYVIPYGTDPYDPTHAVRDRRLYPVIGGELAYADEYGVGAMAVRRDVTPNLLLGQNTVTDLARISATIPLPWREDPTRRRPKMFGLGSVAAARTQFIDPVTAELTRSYNFARIDVGLQYLVRPGFAYTVRYELMIQTGDRSAEMSSTGFFRNTILFSFRYRYPEDVAAAVPRRGALRDDPMAGQGEPVITDLIDLPGDSPR